MSCQQNATTELYPFSSESSIPNEEDSKLLQRPQLGSLELPPFLWESTGGWCSITPDWNATTSLKYNSSKLSIRLPEKINGESLALYQMIIK